MGVTTKKNIIPITNGETIFPKNIPNLNQSIFNGVRILAFNRPKIIKIKEIIKDHILMSSLLVIGYKAINKNTAKKTTPKLRLELILILLLIFEYINLYNFESLRVY